MVGKNTILDPYLGRCVPVPIGPDYQIQNSSGEYEPVKDGELAFCRELILLKRITNICAKAKIDTLEKNDGSSKLVYLCTNPKGCAGNFSNEQDILNNKKMIEKQLLT